MPSPREYAVQNKEMIIKQFCPTFCFSRGEYSFPTSVERYSEDVLRAKMRLYEGKDKFDQDERAEYDLIKRHFFHGGNSESAFDINGFAAEEVKAYTKYEQDANWGNVPKRSIDDLLTFDEKRHGFTLGSQVPVNGVLPDADKKVRAPLITSYIPAEDGAYIKYDAFYPLSGAIPGTNWLYKLLPEKMSKAFSDFAVHAGDLEGVWLKVNIDENGKAELDHVQTFAHGRDGARKVMTQDLTFDEKGHPCIYVGEATHPSYADNFSGRNKFFDKVGDSYRLEPTEFIDFSPGAELPVWASCRRLGSADGPQFNNYVNNEEEYKRKRETGHDGSWGKYNYHPLSENRVVKALLKVFKAVKGFFGKFTGSPQPEEDAPSKVNLSFTPKEPERASIIEKVASPGMEAAVINPEVKAVVASVGQFVAKEDVVSQAQGRDDAANVRLETKRRSEGVKR